MQRNTLRGLIVMRGLTQRDVAERLGMSPKTFSIKLNSGTFGVHEAAKLVEILGISNPGEIFFGQDVNR